MFKSLFGSALVASTAQAIAFTSCDAVTSSALTVWNISDISKGDALSYSAVVSSTDTLTFNYCNSIDSTDDTFAKSSGLNKIVATDFSETTVSNMRADDDTKATIGVEFTMTSETECTAAAGDVEAVNYSLKTFLTCDEEITTAGAATIDSVTFADCQYTVNMKHKAGCPTVTLDTERYMGWLNDNEWAIGIIYVIAGPLIALFGTAWFPYVVSSLIAIFTIGTVVGISLACGLMTSTTGTVITCVVALLVGILAGVLVRKNIWLMIGLVGMIAGFFSGSIVFALISSMSGWEATWGYWVVAAVMAAVGCTLACYMGKSVVLISTALTGSYLFMRSWTMFFPGNYPSESELANDYSSLELGAIFWVFIGVWVVTFVMSAIFQCKHNKTHEDLDDY